MTKDRIEDSASTSDPYFVESLARGLRVLSAFDSTRRELSQKDIAKVAGVTVPSALRIGHTLVKLGYLVRNPTTKGYRPGPRVLTLGMAALSSMSITDITGPHLAALRDATDEAVKLAVLHGTEVIYVARYIPAGKLESGVQIGTRLSATGTSMGRAILSRLPAEEAEALLRTSPHPALTPRSLTDLDDLRRELAATVERGYAINDQGVTLEHRSIAAPLVDLTGRAVAAINISVSAHRVSIEQLRTEFAPKLLRCAEEISALLPSGLVGGYSNPLPHGE